MISLFAKIHIFLSWHTPFNIFIFAPRSNTKRVRGSSAECLPEQAPPFLQAGSVYSKKPIENEKKLYTILFWESIARFPSLFKKRKSQEFRLHPGQTTLQKSHTWKVVWAKPNPQKGSLVWSFGPDNSPWQGLKSWQTVGTKKRGARAYSSCQCKDNM